MSGMLARGVDFELTVVVFTCIFFGRKVKRAPQRWQDEKQVFDIVITFEVRVYEKVLEGILEAMMHMLSCHLSVPKQLLIVSTANNLMQTSASVAQRADRFTSSTSIPKIRTRTPLRVPNKLCN